MLSITSCYNFLAKKKISRALIEMALVDTIRHWLALILLIFHTCFLFSDMFAEDI